ncbi:PREDICTED: uncharacterized protein C6orf222 homolog [Elephantulus edwardii]|uniref:uncharacterized protein C6orf222 homolog n=1 Tax=Elephantulus edwardii TaxID=28737 RepID=UPI0003F0903F|nr:PREDICTED: uncharacterized protein C6orf222 homolog [Elephantulus edwardii]
MENSRGPRKTLLDRRAESLDRSQGPRKNLESRDSLHPSLHTAPCKRVLRRTASDGSRCSESPAQTVEAQDTKIAALSPEETSEFILSEQRLPQDIKKDKTQRRTQSGWLKTLVNFFLRISPEEPKEKASRNPKVKEGFSHSVESPVPSREPTVRKKSHDKKSRRKKNISSKKHVAQEMKGGLDQEATGQEARHPEEDDPAHGDEDDLDFHEPLSTEGGSARVGDGSCPCSGHQWKEELQPEKDAIIQMIVELLQRVGDQWEEERLKTQQPMVILPNLGPVLKRKSVEKKSSFRRAFSHKKLGSEEPKRAGPADAPAPEARPPKRPSFLPLCVGGGHRPSVSSSSDEFIRKICDLLQDAEEQGAEKRLQTQEPEVAVENPGPASRKKSTEKKSSLRRAFSHKKYSSKEAKRMGAADASSSEAPRPPKRPSFLPLCVSGNRPSISDSLDGEDGDFQKVLPAEGGPVDSLEPSSHTRRHKPEGEPQMDRGFESKELIIQKLVALLQQMHGQLGEQIRRHPSFKKFLYKLSDSSLKKLAITLQNQEAHLPEPNRNLDERRYQFAADLVNVFAGNNGHTVHRLIGLPGHYNQNTYAQFLCRKAQQNIKNPESQSPD